VVRTVIRKAWIPLKKLAAFCYAEFRTWAFSKSLAETSVRQFMFLIIRDLLICGLRVWVIPRSVCHLPDQRWHYSEQRVTHTSKVFAYQHIFPKATQPPSWSNTKPTKTWLLEDYRAYNVGCVVKANVTFYWLRGTSSVRVKGGRNPLNKHLTVLSQQAVPPWGSRSNHCNLQYQYLNLHYYGLLRSPCFRARI
jgi:hypothetical protein